jgi:hypothetical protein
MANKEFIQLLKTQPNEVSYHHIAQTVYPLSRKKDETRIIRDALVEKIVQMIGERDAFHQASQLEELLSTIGLNLKIVDELKDEQEQQRVLVSSMGANQATTSLSFLLDWENAHTTSFRTLTTLVEHQMQQYLIAIEKISQAIQEINPEIHSFIEQYPSEINILEFSIDLCTIASCLATQPDFHEATQQLYHSQQAGSVSSTDQSKTLTQKCRQEIGEALGYQPEKVDIWINLFSSTDSNSLLNINQQLDSIMDAQNSAEAALASPLSASSHSQTQPGQQLNEPQSQGPTSP